MTKLEAVMAEHRHWQEIIGISTVAELNAAVREGLATDIINIAEALQERRFAAVADDIVANGKRLVLLAGPSSSGKTTTCKRLGVQLAACGVRPRMLSTDDYDVNREQTPLDEKGEYDFECLQAVDIPYFNQHLADLLAGKSVERIRYDFVSGRRQYTGEQMELRENEVLIIEGIHALNPDLTPQIPDDIKYRLYVSALTTIQLDEHHRISTSDNRLLRRIIRDKQFRGYSAEETIRRWPSVRAGEEKWIFPYQENCDRMINSALLYEIAALRNHIMPILECVPADAPEADEALHLRGLVGFFEPIPDTQIPPTSLLREFLGGSSFKY